MTEPVSIRFGDLATASFLDRPNRFIVRCRLTETGEDVQAHLADPGRLKELLLPGATLHLRFVDDPQRKTQWSAVLVLAPDHRTYVSLQAALANRLVEQALKAGIIGQLANWDTKRREYAYGSSRWDFLLKNSKGRQMLLEVKSCTLVQDGVAMFPDAVTERGRRHVQELTRLRDKSGFETAVLFVVQRGDGKIFRPAVHIDPAFAEALKVAHHSGVKVFVYDCAVDPMGITWGRELGMDFS